MQKASRASTINNFNISHARSIASRHFGENVYEVVQDEQKFIMRLREEVASQKLDDFLCAYPEFEIFTGNFQPYIKKSNCDGKI